MAVVFKVQDSNFILPTGNANVESEYGVPPLHVGSGSPLYQSSKGMLLSRELNNKPVKMCALI
jgi:hypothetical protein